MREHLRAQLSTSGGKQATLELSQLLRLPHTSPPPYVDLTPRRLSAHLDGTMQAPPRQPLASVPEVRAVAAAMSCCGGVASVHAVDVRLSEDCVTALGEALRYSPRLATLSLNHVRPKNASARPALGVLKDALPRSRAPLTSLDLAHNALLEEATLLRLVAALRTLPSALHSLNLDGCGLAPRSVLPLCALLCEPAWSSTLWSLSLAHNSLGKDDGTHALAQTLRRTTALLELDVTGAHLDLAAVVDALVSNETLAGQLSLLHLGTNKLSRAAALQLAEFVSLSRSLRGLGISRTQLLPEGFEPILAAALANPNLDGLALDASENELGERCAKAIAQHLLGAAKTPAQRRLGSAGGAAATARARRRPTATVARAAVCSGSSCAPPASPTAASPRCSPRSPTTAGCSTSTSRATSGGGWCRGSAATAARRRWARRSPPSSGAAARCARSRWAPSIRTLRV